MIIYGINPVREAIRSQQIHVQQVWLAVKKPGFALGHVPVTRTDKGTIGKLTGTSSHQGIAAEIGDFPYADEHGPLSADQPMNLVMLDRVNDPHNLGAVIRVCEGAGVDAVIIGRRFGTGVTAAVFKVSAGAAAHLPVISVESLPHYAGQLKDAGFKLLAVEAGEGALPLAEIDRLSGGKNLFLFGSEGEGMSRNLLEKADIRMELPMKGHVNSLNLSTSVAATLYRLII